MRTFRFYKTRKTNGRMGWFVDLPEWKESVAELEMVEGADKFLDKVAKGKRDVHLTIGIEPFQLDTEPIKTDAHILEKVGEPDYGGGIYHLEEWYGEKYDKSMWLCDVVKFIYGHMPDKIYIA